MAGSAATYIVAPATCKNRLRLIAFILQIILSKTPPGARNELLNFCNYSTDFYNTAFAKIEIPCRAFQRVPAEGSASPRKISLPFAIHPG